MHDTRQVTEPATLVILNPAAGAARVEDDLRAHVRPAERWEIHVTTGPGDASLAVANCPNDVDLVVAVGGDGTVHECVNGLMRRPASSRPALAIVPVGSGNDLAAMFAIPSQVERALEVARTGRRRRVDVGCCNGIWFVNAVSLGLDARVAVRAAELKKRTSATGLWLYLRALMHVLLRELTSFDAVVAADGGPAVPARMTLLAACNGRMYGGGFRVAPDAEPDDGLLDIVSLDEIGLAEALWRLPFFIAGKHTKMRPVHIARRHTLSVSCESTVTTQIDGEVILADRYDISVSPLALEIVVP